MFHYTTIATLLALMFYFYTSVLVARARMLYGVKAPAISGHPDFERVFRVQANTLEWMPIFLPSLWLFAYYLSDTFAAAFGALWVIGRVIYMIGYSEAAERRGAGFAEGMTMSSQFLVQVTGVGVTALWSGVATWVLLKVLAVVTGLRPAR